MGDEEGVGMYCRSSDGTEVKAEPSDIVKDKPADVLVMIPEMMAGDVLCEGDNAVCGERESGQEAAHSGL
jgi:hypothetical protein